MEVDEGNGVIVVDDETLCWSGSDNEEETRTKQQAWLANVQWNTMAGGYLRITNPQVDIPIHSRAIQCLRRVAVDQLASLSEPLNGAWEAAITQSNKQAQLILVNTFTAVVQRYVNRQVDIELDTMVNEGIVDCRKAGLGYQTGLPARERDTGEIAEQICSRCMAPWRDNIQRCRQCNGNSSVDNTRFITLIKPEGTWYLDILAESPTWVLRDPNGVRDRETELYLKKAHTINLGELMQPPSKCQHYDPGTQGVADLLDTPWLSYSSPTTEYAENTAFHPALDTLPLPGKLDESTCRSLEEKLQQLRQSPLSTTIGDDARAARHQTMTSSRNHPKDPRPPPQLHDTDVHRWILTSEGAWRIMDCPEDTDDVMKRMNDLLVFQAELGRMHADNVKIDTILQRGGLHRELLDSIPEMKKAVDNNRWDKCEALLDLIHFHRGELRVKRAWWKEINEPIEPQEIEEETKHLAGLMSNTMRDSILDQLNRMTKEREGGNGTHLPVDPVAGTDGATTSAPTTSNWKYHGVFIATHPDFPEKHWRRVCETVGLWESIKYARKGVTLTQVYDWWSHLPLLIPSRKRNRNTPSREANNKAKAKARGQAQDWIAACGLLTEAEKQDPKLVTKLVSHLHTMQYVTSNPKYIMDLPEYPVDQRDTKDTMLWRAMYDERLTFPINDLPPDLRVRFGNVSHWVHVESYYRCNATLWKNEETSTWTLASLNEADKDVHIRTSEPVPSGIGTSGHYGLVECGVVLSADTQWDYRKSNKSSWICRFCGGKWSRVKSGSRFLQLFDGQFAYQMILDEPPGNLETEWAQERLAYYRRLEPRAELRDVRAAWPVNATSHSRIRCINTPERRMSDEVWKIIFNKDNLPKIHERARSDLNRLTIEHRQTE